MPPVLNFRDGRVAELVYAVDLKSADQKSCGFKSHLAHQIEKALSEKTGLFLFLADRGWDLNGFATDGKPRHPCYKVAGGKFVVVASKTRFVLRRQGKSALTLNYQDFPFVKCYTVTTE